MTPTSIVHQFLAAGWPCPTPDERFEIRMIRPGEDRVARRFCNTAAEVVARVLSAPNGVNAYLAVGLRDRSGSGGKDHVTRIAACYADMDFKLWRCEDPRAAALAAIERFIFRPSIALDSGGGFQLWWILADPLDVRDVIARDRFEALNGALARAICQDADSRPDSVFDCARVLRPPCTFNVKYTPARPVSLLWLHPDRTYTLDQLAAAVQEHYPWAKRPTAAAQGARAEWTRCDEAPHDLRERAARGRIRRSTLALLDESGPANYASPSEADAAIAAGLIGAGLTTGEVLTLLLDCARGQDALRRKGERHGLAYLRRTVEHAAGFVGPVLDTPRGNIHLVRPPQRRPHAAVVRPPTRPFTLVGGQAS